jgi:hypothetical protein
VRWERPAVSYNKCLYVVVEAQCKLPLEIEAHGSLPVFFVRIRSTNVTLDDGLSLVPTLVIGRIDVFTYSLLLISATSLSVTQTNELSAP